MVRKEDLERLLNGERGVQLLKKLAEHLDENVPGDMGKVEAEGELRFEFAVLDCPDDPDNYYLVDKATLQIMQTQ